MAQLVVRNLDDDVRERLRERARRHGRSMEAEVREILRCAVLADEPQRGGLGTRISEQFSEYGVEDEVHELRGGEAPRSPDFGS